MASGRSGDQASDVETAVERHRADRKQIGGCRWHDICLPLASPRRCRVAFARWLAYGQDVATPPHRTLLEKLVRESRWTIEETCRAFEKKARDLGEQASLSPRQLARWMSGDVDRPRPVMQRVAEVSWGHSFDLLLGPPDVPNDNAGQHLPVAGRAVASDDVYRRTILHLGAASITPGFATTTGSDLDDDYVITGEEIERLSRTVARQRRLDARHGAADLWEIAAGRAQRIAWLLDHAQYSDEIGEQLVELAGHAYICAGWLATDAGQHEAAHTCYIEALSLAGQAQSPQIQVHALSNLALHEVILRRPRRALRYVAAAERALPTQPVGRIRPMLTMRRARLLGMMGDAHEARKAFTAARHALDQDRATPASWLTFFDHAEIDAVEADAALDLHDAKRGTTLLERSLASYDARFARNRCLHLVRLAKARTGAGHLDGAAEATDEALDLLDTDVTSARVATELRSVADQLHQHERSRAVADVLARYRTNPYGATA